MNYRSSGGSSINRTPANVMEYLKTIRSFTVFSQLFEPSRPTDPIKIENFIFILHSRATVMILMIGRHDY